jgi:glyoxylase-like metal-dependent hydrolase (beta-lactamase superfamily II)
MPNDLTTISLPLPLGMGRVNCYLLRTGPGFILIDTGGSNGRKELLNALASAGCQPGQIKLIVITHGDFDHAGNAAYLRKIFDAKILMHKDDLGMVETGDMFYNRQKPNLILRKLIGLYASSGKKDRFTPDLLVEDGCNLSAYGLDAKVVSIPGHSKGSIGILTTSGDLFCGDLLISTKKPALNSLMDDPPAANLSLQKLVSLGAETVYPGHGEPFPLKMIETVSS